MVFWSIFLFFLFHMKLTSLWACYYIFLQCFLILQKKPLLCLFFFFFNSCDSSDFFRLMSWSLHNFFFLLYPVFLLFNVTFEEHERLWNLQLLLSFIKQMPQVKIWKFVEIKPHLKYLVNLDNWTLFSMGWFHFAFFFSFNELFIFLLHVSWEMKELNKPKLLKL